MAPIPVGAIHNFGSREFPMSEDVSLRFTAAGFVLAYFFAIGAICLASLAHYRALLACALVPAGLVGAALLAVGWLRPSELTRP